MLTKESERFLENLRMYLMTTGKRDTEIKGIVEELESHLAQAEADGKSVDEIIGESPQAYMASIAVEMEPDIKQAVLAGVATIFGALSISMFSDILSGKLTFSIFKLLGMIGVFALFTTVLVIAARKLSAKNVSTKKAAFVLAPLFVLPTLMLFGILLLDNQITSPTIELKGLPVYVIGAIAFGMIIALSVWAKSWIMLLVLGIIIAPELLQKLFQFSDMVSVWLLIGFVMLFNIGILTTMKRKVQ